MHKIVRAERVVPNTFIMEVEALELSRKAKPGQFIIVMGKDEAERIPFSIADTDPEKGTITFFFLEVGLSTMKLAKFKTGESLYSVVGPLGKPSSIGKFGNVFLGGGCYGIGAIYPIAKALKEAGNTVTCCIEARSTYLLYFREKLAKTSDRLVLSTSDGSEGKKGHVDEVMKDMFQKGEKPDRIYLIGCPFMMMTCSEVSKPHGVPTRVSLNPVMVDGTGMCGCCRVTVGGKTLFACVDGPEFDGHKVDWDELFQRKNTYAQEEAYSYHKCKIGLYEH